jgi:hypothetical protein
VTNPNYRRRSRSRRDPSAALVGHQIASGNTLAPRALWAEIEAAIKKGTDVVEKVSRELNIDSKSALRHVLGAQRHS